MKDVAEDIEIISTYNHPERALPGIRKSKPDAVFLDIEMPGMNGMEFIRRLLPQYPVPVIVVSSVSHAVFEAMSAGAIDFVTKPDMQTASGVAGFFKELINKIKIASTANVMKDIQGKDNIGGIVQTSAAYKHKLIAIGIFCCYERACILRNIRKTSA